MALTLMYIVCCEVPLWDACYLVNSLHNINSFLSLRLHVQRLHAVYMLLTSSGRSLAIGVIVTSSRQ